LKPFLFKDVRALVGGHRAAEIKRRVLAGERLKLKDVLYPSEYTHSMFRKDRVSYEVVKEYE
jgi:hypothetical protein